MFLVILPLAPLMQTLAPLLQTLVIYCFYIINHLQSFLLNNFPIVFSHSYFGCLTVYSVHYY